MGVGTPVRLRRALVAVELEAIEGSAETLVAADANIKAENISFTPTLPFYSREAVSASFSPWAGTSGGPRLAEISFEVMMAGSGTAATPPSVSDALRACSLAESIGATVIYLPCSTVTAGGDGSSATVGFQADGLLYQIHGARGNVRLLLPSGEPGKFAFTFRGIYNEPSAVELYNVTTYETTISPAIVSGAFVLNSIPMKYKSLEIDLGNKLSDRPDASAAQGAFSIFIAGREPTLALDPEMLAVATHNFFNKMTTNTEMALSLTVGSVSGNKYVITAPKVQYTGLAPGDRDGAQIIAVTARLNRNAGDDELSIVHST